MEEVRAWLSLTQLSKAGGCTGASVQDTDVLVRGLKVADFLCDATLTAAISKHLLLKILGEYTTNQHVKLDPPSDVECARAFSVLQAVPSHKQCNILAAVVNVDCSPASSKHHCCLTTAAATASPRLHADDWQLSRLLQLLPSSLHTTILQECVLRHGGGRRFTVPVMRACSRHCPEARTRTASRDDRSGHGVQALAEDCEWRRCGPCCVPVMYQLLAAAAPLAGGRLDLASAADWPPGFRMHMDDAHAASKSPTGEDATGASGGTDGDSDAADVADGCSGSYSGGPALKRLCPPRHHRPSLLDAETPPLLSLNSPAITSLKLALDVDEYGVLVPAAADLCPGALGPALRALPALESLQLTCALSQLYNPRAEPPESQHAAVEQLLNCVATLTGLSALTLEHCFYLGGPLNQHCEVAELSRLTRLTSLVIVACIADTSSTSELTHALQQLTSLRSLQVDVPGPGQQIRHLWGLGVGTTSHDELDSLEACTAASRDLLLQLCTLAQLSGLQALPLRIMPDWRGTPSVGELHGTLMRRNPALLSRLTVLELSNHVDGQFTHEVARLLGDTPALRELCLRDATLQDAGLAALAAALPCVPHLARLDVYGTIKTTHEGVVAILEALGSDYEEAVTSSGSAAHACLGIRDLNISQTRLKGADAAQLGRLLLRLDRLETLNIQRVGLRAQGGGMKAVFAAVAALPRLRRLHVFGRDECWWCSPEERDARLRLCEGLKDVCIVCC